MTSTALHLPSSATARWSWIPLVVGCELVGILGAAATSTGGSVWYQELATPVFQPPARLFGPVWTLLYAMMGIAAWRVWRSRAERPLKRWALTLFGVQLALNATWTPVFFGVHRVGLALVVMGALWIALAATILAFRGVDRTASLLLLPYLAWVSFALILNDAIWRLN